MEWIEKESGEQVADAEAYMTPKGVAIVRSTLKDNGTYTVERIDPWIQYATDGVYGSTLFASGSDDDIENIKAICSTQAMELKRAGAFGPNIFFNSSYDSLSLRDICRKLMEDGEFGGPVDVEKSSVNLHENNGGDRFHIIAVPGRTTDDHGYEVKIAQRVNGDMFEVFYEIRESDSGNR